MLRALLQAAAAGDRLVASGPAGELTLAGLWQRAAVVAAALPAPSPGSMVAFAFGDDRIAFAAALLGTWLAGHGAALPENAQRERVVPVLSRPEVVAFLHDTGVGRGIFVPRLLAAAAAGSMPASVPHDPDRVVMATYSSGADGSLQASRWTASELLATVDQLVARMRLAAGSALVNSLTPSFAPAVLAGLLLPLRCGARITKDTARAVEDLAAAVRREAAPTLLLSPAGLRQLAGLPGAALAPLQRIVCAGTASPRACAILQQRHGVDIVEVGAGWIEASQPGLAACVERLCGIASVDDAAVVMLPDAPGQQPTALVAVAAPASLQAELLREAQAALPAAVTVQLRTFAQLPRDANGKLLHADLFLGLGFGRDGRRVARTLPWQEVRSAAGRRFRTQVPERYAFFEGHFAPYPVLAGAVQLHELVLPCVRAVAPDLGPLQRLANVKFQARIAPGDQLEVAIARVGVGCEFDFEIWRGQVRCASGRLAFGAAAVGAG